MVREHGPRRPDLRAMWYNRAVFELLDERDSPQGTVWTLQWIDRDGGLHRSEFRLAWPDYDVWSPDGCLAPSTIAEAVVRFALDRPEFDPLPKVLDAAMPRRRIPGADDQIARLMS